MASLIKYILRKQGMDMHEIYSKAAGRSYTYKFSWLDDSEIGELDKA